MSSWQDYLDMPVPKTRWRKKVIYKFKLKRTSQDRSVLRLRRQG